ncbi:MAG: hypothetical protein ABS87_00870 [Sphingomonas sp. SCN 67-18]|uniref:hypothetical protein n=1 Tax=uncultured Sphingomonas sp. TaxID=158754 RepID=UPI000869E491|nr:hypothetical protein [Sphingomonas sp. SCN 67-18]ODU22750.1 MAG: hypothetical protein ABS87_00870 [Sphingomonas sp. SCN 67-18]
MSGRPFMFGNAPILRALAYLDDLKSLQSGIGRFKAQRALLKRSGEVVSDLIDENRGLNKLRSDIINAITEHKAAEVQAVAARDAAERAKGGDA